MLVKEIVNQAINMGVSARSAVANLTNNREYLAYLMQESAWWVDQVYTFDFQIIERVLPGRFQKVLEGSLNLFLLYQ
jgi:site-specific recombinase XerC